MMRSFVPLLVMTLADCSDSVADIVVVVVDDRASSLLLAPFSNEFNRRR